MLYANDEYYHFRTPDNRQESDKVINEIYEECVERLCEKYHLLYLADLYHFPEKIDFLGGAFGMKRMISVDELRPLVLALLADFQEAINNNEKIRPLLVEYPFPADRITIMIGLCDGDKLPPHDEVSNATSEKGFLCYRFSDLIKIVQGKEEIKESLEEACEKAGIDPATISPIYSLYDDTGRFLKSEKNDNPTTQKE
mgnify:FL=1|jgi:hypothetical protein